MSLNCLSEDVVYRRCTVYRNVLSIQELVFETQKLQTKVRVVIKQK